MDLSKRPMVSAAGDHSARWLEPAQPTRARAVAWLTAPWRAGTSAGRLPLVLTLLMFMVAFLLPAWPWLSGRLTIPWDAKSQFFPQVQFLASSFARGEWPWWSPNVFAGWPQISDPQSLLFSPLHVLLAIANPAVSLRAFDAVTFAYLFLGGVGIILFFRDRGWHAGGALVAAMAFALGGAASARLQHTGQVISLAYLPLVLWLLARALERPSWRAGLAAGAIAGLMALGRDQVALLSLYVLTGFVFADLFGAMDPAIEYWAPQSLIWDAAWGWPGLYLSQNMPLVYAGALTLVVVVSFGLVRGLAWEREIRFFTIAAALALLYALGGYTPAFHVMYDLLPGVSLYRRTADATFVLVALVAILAGYLVHRWLTGTVPRPARWQRALEIACAVLLIAAALAVASSVVGIRPVLVPIATAIVFTAAAITVLLLARRMDAHWPAAAAGLLAAFMAAATASSWSASAITGRTWRSRTASTTCSGTIRSSCAGSTRRPTPATPSPSRRNAGSRRFIRPIARPSPTCSACA
jgi:hypothetical protein